MTTCSHGIAHALRFQKERSQVLSRELLSVFCTGRYSPLMFGVDKALDRIGISLDLRSF